jgi:uncharacterized membrane protein HdeD (DUF308 family)
MSDSNLSTASGTQTAGAVWYYVGGILSIFVGFAAISAPYLFSGMIALLIGSFALVSGIFLFFSAVFGKTRKHRILDFFSAFLRVVVGILLLSNVGAAVQALTLLLAAVFLAEGLVGIYFGLQLRAKNPAWIWILLNGFVALVLGGMLLAKFPGDSEWAIGLLFGINSVFLGFSFIMFAAALPKAQDA